MGLAEPALALCRAYCERHECPGKNSPECNRLRILFSRQAPGMALPCDGVCGNNVADAGEQCGEPGLASCPAPFECRSCRCRGCGDGQRDVLEFCGEPGLPQCPAGRECRECVCVSPCGNGRIDPGEQCEPGLASPSCPAERVCHPFNCRCTACGNGVLDPGEDCEVDLHCSPGTFCLGCLCFNGNCGDGSLDEGEECDFSVPGGSFQAGGDSTSAVVPVEDQCPQGGTCLKNCTCSRPLCGNGTVEPGEECDPPGSPCGCDGGVCFSLLRCSPSCTCEELNEQ